MRRAFVLSVSILEDASLEPLLIPALLLEPLLIPLLLVEVPPVAPVFALPLLLIPEPDRAPAPIPLLVEPEPLPGVTAPS